MFAGCPFSALRQGAWGWADDAPADGTAAASIRPVRANDLPALNAFFLGLSPRSRRLRFHGAVNTLPASALQRLSAPDDTGHATLVMETPDGQRIIGEARYVVDPDDPIRAEFALAVADEWHGQGLGRTLLQHLLERAREQGLSALHGSVLDENAPMLALVQAMGGRAARAPGASYALEWQLSTEAYSPPLASPPSSGMPPSSNPIAPALWLPSSPLRV